jgi:hypothetical protein
MAEPGAPAERGPVALNRGEVISAISALLLLVLMFAVQWYGVVGIPGRSGSRTGIDNGQDAWHALSILRWLMLLTVALAFGAAAIHLRRPSQLAVAGTRLALLVLATLSAALLIYRVLIVLPSPDRIVDQKLGAILGVLGSLGVVFGAYESVREQRARMVALSMAENRVASGRAAM